MLRFVIQWIKDSLGFSRSEANGTLVLIVVIILMIVLPKLFLSSFEGDNPFESDRGKLDRYAELLNASIVEKKREKEKVEAIRAPKSFSFDPNSATREELISLGFSERSVENLMNYKASGGRFSTKKDLKRIYGISSARIDELWGQIQLPENNLTVKLEDKIDSPVEITKIDLNLADASAFQRIRGIGPTLSKRITDFRDKLGGFYHQDQLYEVYGLDSSVVNVLISQSQLTSAVAKINLNTDSLKHLYKHPYIDYNLARAILNFKNQRGKLDSIGQIKEIKIIDEGLYQKIYPYLSLNP